MGHILGQRSIFLNVTKFQEIWWSFLFYIFVLIFTLFSFWELESFFKQYYSLYSWVGEIFFEYDTKTNIFLRRLPVRLYYIACMIDIRCMASDKSCCTKLEKIRYFQIIGLFTFFKVRRGDRVSILIYVNHTK